MQSTRRLTVVASSQSAANPNNSPHFALQISASSRIIINITTSRHNDANMSDSDGEYVDDLSGDDNTSHQVSTGHGTRSAGPVKGPTGSTTRGGDTNTSNRRRAAWEDIQRSWDTVVEGADGSINSAVEVLREAGKRKRFVL